MKRIFRIIRIDLFGDLSSSRLSLFLFCYFVDRDPFGGLKATERQLQKIPAPVLRDLTPKEQSEKSGKSPSSQTKLPSPWPDAERPLKPAATSVHDPQQLHRFAPPA